jgi:hypothetical protein
VLLHDLDRRFVWIPDVRGKLQKHYDDLIENTYKPLTTLRIYFPLLPNPLELSVGYSDIEGRTHEITELPEYGSGIKHLKDRDYEKVSDSLFAILRDVSRFNSEIRKEVNDVGLEEAIKKVLPNFQGVTMEAARGLNQFTEAKPNQYVKEWLWQAVVTLLGDSQSEIDRIVASPVDSVILRITNVFYVLQIDGHDVAKGSETDLRTLLGEVIRALPKFKELRTKQMTYDKSRIALEAFKEYDFSKFLFVIDKRRIVAGECDTEIALKPPYGLHRVKPFASWLKKKVAKLRRRRDEVAQNDLYRLGNRVQLSLLPLLLKRARYPCLFLSLESAFLSSPTSCSVMSFFSRTE